MKKRSNEKLELQRKEIEFLFEEAIPKGESQRRQYMADCALFYSSVFKDKLKHFIGMQMEELAQVGRIEQMNDFIRANINCFRLIEEWFEKNTAEHFGNLEELRSTSSDDTEFINKFKKDYGNI